MSMRRRATGWMPVTFTRCKDGATVIQPSRSLQCKTRRSLGLRFDYTSCDKETFWFPCGLGMATPLQQHSPVPKCPLFNAMIWTPFVSLPRSRVRSSRMEETNWDCRFFLEAKPTGPRTISGSGADTEREIAKGQGK
jgi:hypothetical protein